MYSIYQAYRKAATLVTWYCNRLNREFETVLTDKILNLNLEDEIKNVNSNTSSKTPQLKAKKISEFFRTNLSIKNENSLNLFAKEAIREEPIISKLTSEKENETINPDLDKTDSSPHHKRSRSN